MGQACGATAPCGTGQTCVQGQCQSGTNGYVPGRDAALDAARGAAAIACRRLYSDCADLCTNPFVFCGSSETQCVEEIARQQTEDIDPPFTNTALAAICGDQIRTRSCQGLDPNSVACDNAVVAGCANDADAFGNNYAFAGAYALPTLPFVIEAQVCEDVGEWFSLTLGAGDRLVVSLLDATGTGSTRVELYAQVDPLALDFPQPLETKSFSENGDADRFDHTFAGVPTAGTYLLMIERNSSASTLRLAVGTVANPPQTRTDVLNAAAHGLYAAACARLHDDCAAQCSGSARACGATAEACAQQMQDGTPPVWLDRDTSLADIQACTASMGTAACNALVPTTPPCSLLFPLACPTDPEGMSRPTSWRRAVPVTAPQTVQLNLCRDVSQWFRMGLQQGQRPTVLLQTDPPSGWVNVRMYSAALDADQLDSERGWLISTAISYNSLEALDPAPAAGDHLVQVELVNGSLSALDVQLGIQP